MVELYVNIVNDIFDRRARLIVELVIELDIPSDFILDCLDDKECNNTLTEIAENVEVSE